MNVIKALGALSQGKQDYFHREANKYANKILKEIAKNNGKTDQKLIKLSDEYAKDVLGWKGYAPWLYVYSAVNNKFIEGWIPANYYYATVVPAIKGRHGKISNIKTMSYKVFKSDFFPDIGYYVNGLWISRDNRIIPENEVKDFLFRDSEKIIFKVDNSSRAKGIFLIQKDSFKRRMKSFGNGVFQKYIEQHPFLEEFISSSVATIRLTTVMDNRGEASVRACYLRLGRGTDEYVKYNSSVWIPVEMESGELGERGFFGIDTWRAIDKHPDSKIPFARKKIPHFEKCISAALELQKLIPFVRCIGWDMCIDKEGEVNVLEWNGDNNGIIFGEVTQGPCFSDLGWEQLWKE